ncbi:MAG: 2-amino-4-hydroxy-6-hydroxymethyldihydropteridine diphosphokinase [Bacteroidota bacterium]
MAKVIILGGSNSGDREFFLDSSLTRITAQIGSLDVQSALYETEPWGFESRQHFLNRIWVIETLLPPLEVLSELLSIERELGRVRSGNGYSSRVIDLDILYYDQQIIQQAGLEIPHPRISERNFVLLPLNEILPDFVHPVLKLSNHDLLLRSADPGIVRKY